MRGRGLLSKGFSMMGVMVGKVVMGVSVIDDIQFARAFLRLVTAATTHERPDIVVIVGGVVVVPRHDGGGKISVESRLDMAFIWEFLGVGRGVSVIKGFFHAHVQHVHENISHKR